MHRVGGGDDIVAHLAVGEAAFWVGAASPVLKRLSPLVDPFGHEWEIGKPLGAWPPR